MATAVKAEQRRSRPEQGGKFRVVTGSYVGDGPEGCQCDGCARSGGKDHVYNAYDTYVSLLRTERPDPHDPEWKRQTPLPRDQYDNDIIDSEIDLCRRFNQWKNGILVSAKFERLGESVQYQQAAQPPAPYPLERMTVPELKAMIEMEELEVDISKFKSKEQLVAAVRSALGETTGESGD